MQDILIQNIDFLYTFDTRRTRLNQADIYIRDNIIVEIGPCLQHPEAQTIIDGRGKLALPGLINTHHHFYQNLTRNVPIMQKGGLLAWLLYSYGAWADLNADAVYAAARLSAAELLLTGCTTSLDFMYFFPYGQHDLMDVEFDAVSQLGLRFHGLRGCMPVMEGDLALKLSEVLGMQAKPLLESPEESLRACEATFQKYHDNSAFAMQRVGVGPTTTVYQMPELMRDLKSLADRYGGLCHSHLHPRPDEIEACQRLYQCTPHQWLESIGWFDYNTSIAHATEHNAEDIAILARNGVSVTHSPSCHMRLGYPVAPIPAMRRAGVNIGIGVDGGSSNDSSDMLGELRTTMYVHRIRGVHADFPVQEWFGPEDVFEIATLGGARLLNRDDIGTLTVGKAADIVLFDLRQIAYGGAMADPLGALVYCGYNHTVDTNIINGRVVVEQGVLRTADQEEIFEDANRAALRILNRVKARTGFDYQQA